MKVIQKSRDILIIIGLSVLMGCFSLILTTVPSDLKLIKALLLDGYVLIMNSWPIFISMLILYFLTTRVWISFLSIAVLTFVIAEVNRFKIVFRDDPFVFSDLVLINEAKDMMGKYELFLDGVSLLTIIFIIGTTLACFFLVKRRGLNKWIRMAGVVLSIIVMVTTINQFYFKDTNIYKKTWHPEFGSEWKDGSQYMSRGVLYSFIRSIPDAFVTSPEEYKKKEVEAFFSKYEEKDIPENQKVHIISIMLEAYNDFSQFEGVEFVDDPYKNFHALQQDSYYGKLFTDIFAAGTVNTERSFLTGYNDTSSPDRKTESFVQYFKRQGYYADSMHPCYGWFYDRQKVNLNLGFDKFDHAANVYVDIPDEELERPRYHGLLSDYDFFDYIIEGYEDTVSKGEKYFNFSVTYQNHGQYYNGVESSLVYLERKEEYTEAEYNILNNYLRGIAYTDEALQKLRDYVDAQTEPIVLILFGDHNPWLGEGNSVYSMLGIDFDMGTPKGAENYYQTPYVIYANDVAKASLGKDFKQEGNTVSPMFLMQEFFSYVGWEGSAYMNYLHELREDYSVINKVYAKTPDGYIPRAEANEDEKIKQLKLLEYYIKYDKR